MGTVHRARISTLPPWTNFILGGQSRFWLINQNYEYLVTEREEVRRVFPHDSTLWLENRNREWLSTLMKNRGGGGL